MKLLLLGRDGQVGAELARLLQPLGEVAALGRGQCDLASADQIAARVREARPDIVVNAAAYTAVDRAEREPQAAAAINAAAPGVLAEEAKRAGALLVHYSTDYVFDGAKGAPYVESDPVNPLQVYGRSKLAGERAVSAAGGRHLILRTSWVYAARGRNFMLAILGKARQEPRLRVVADQRGTPTWARDIAALTAALVALREPPTGLYHAASGGEASWWDFAREIVRLAGLAVEVEAIRTADYPTPTPRPRYTVLSSAALAHASGVPPIGDWKARLSALDQLEVLRDLGRLH